MTYRDVKRTVLIFLLGGLSFLFGYLYFGSHLASLFGKPSRSAAAPSGGPPAPIMQEIRLLKERIAQNPRDADAYSELANLYFQANKFDQALVLYEKAVALNEKDIVARNDLALCYHIEKRDKEAFQELYKALEISPRAQHLWLTLGLVDYETGDTKGAKKALKHAYEIDPHSEAGTQAKSMMTSLLHSEI